ncbi:MAG: hypothetical protein ISR74_03475 [Candidatus Thioglobus sp.]|nr:hypothetical protein [Candidatus Thioglobus pontius]MBL6984648.1 hypothetical protein [Candidatus Thioglobus sp.]
MKPIKTKSIKTVKLFRMMDMDITEQQLKQAKAWYQSAKLHHPNNLDHSK